MQAILVVGLATFAGMLGAVAGVITPAYLLGRLHIYYEPGQHLIWAFPQSVGGVALPWLLLVAAMRALGAFGLARLTFAAWSMRPTWSATIILFAVLVSFDFGRLMLFIKLPQPRAVHAHSIWSVALNTLAALLAMLCVIQ
jgi:hypothetical protein